MAHAAGESRLNIAEAADYLRTSERHIQSMYRDGRLPFVRVGRKIVFLVSDLDRFVAANRVAATTAQQQATS
jgi:excisionase family DNA binding protein